MMPNSELRIPRLLDPGKLAAWEMGKFWYNVTKAGELKYGPRGEGSFVQIQRNGKV